MSIIPIFGTKEEFKLIRSLTVIIIGFVISMALVVNNANGFLNDNSQNVDLEMTIETTKNTEPTIPEEILPNEDESVKDPIVQSQSYWEKPQAARPFDPLLNPDEIHWYGETRVESVGYVTTQAGGYDFDREFLAKLLYHEARGSNWEGQVFTCSAILNYCDEHGRSLWDVGHDVNSFAVAPWVDSGTPKEMQYKVIDFVLNGGRIEDICYFRTKNYHKFGVPVCEVDGHYFSMPKTN